MFRLKAHYALLFTFLFFYPTQARVRILLNDDNLTNRQLLDYAESIKAEVIFKNYLTCGNYAGFCSSGSGMVELHNEEYCKMWLGNYLCKNAQDARGIRNTLRQIQSRQRKPYDYSSNVYH